MARQNLQKYKKNQQEQVENEIYNEKLKEYIDKLNEIKKMEKLKDLSNQEFGKFYSKEPIIICSKWIR